MCWHVCANTHCQSAPGRSPLPHVYPWPLQSGSSQGNLKINLHICNLWIQLHTLNSPGTPPSNQNTQQCCVKVQKSVKNNCQYWWLGQKKDGKKHKHVPLLHSRYRVLSMELQFSKFSICLGNIESGITDAPCCALWHLKSQDDTWKGKAWTLFKWCPFTVNIHYFTYKYIFYIYKYVQIKIDYLSLCCKEVIQRTNVQITGQNMEQAL